MVGSSSLPPSVDLLNPAQLPCAAWPTPHRPGATALSSMLPLWPEAVRAGDVSDPLTFDSAARHVNAPDAELARRISHLGVPIGGCRRLVKTDPQSTVASEPLRGPVEGDDYGGLG